MRLTDKASLETKADRSEIQLTDDTRQLRDALLRTHQERFYFTTRLYKIQQTLSKATIVHRSDTLKK